MIIFISFLIGVIFCTIIYPFLQSLQELIFSKCEIIKSKNNIKIIANNYETEQLRSKYEKTDIKVHGFNYEAEEEYEYYDEDKSSRKVGY